MGIRSLIVSFSALMFVACGHAGDTEKMPGATPKTPTEGSTQDTTVSVGQVPDSTQQTGAPSGTVKNATSSEANDLDLTKRGELDLLVKDPAKTATEIETLMQIHGAYVFGKKVETSPANDDDGTPETVKLMTFELKVDVKKFDIFLIALKKLGTPTIESVHVRDVTAAWLDLTATLETHQTVESRLLAMVSANAQDVDKTLKIEKELGEVREKIAHFQARIKAMEQAVSYATILLTLKIDDQTTFEKLPFADRVREAFRVSTDNLGFSFQALVILWVAALPWLVIFGVLVTIIAIVTRILRRQQR